MSMQKLFIQAITNFESDNMPEPRLSNANPMISEQDASFSPAGSQIRQSPNPAGNTDPEHTNMMPAPNPSPKKRKRARKSMDGPVSASDIAFRLNPASARYAVILAEIIGQPVSKRQRRTPY